MSHVEVGQVWADNDKRMVGRKVRVLRIFRKEVRGVDTEFAEVQSVHGNGKVTLRTDRMGEGPKGGKLAWSLVSE